MMVIDRTASTWEHRSVADLPEVLDTGDLLVVNDTRVIPARLFGTKEGTGGKVELLLLEEIEPNTWDVLLRASRRPPIGSRILIGSGGAVAELLEDGTLGRAKIRIHSERPFLEIAEEEGVPPLPPYISRQYPHDKRTPEDRDRYQTVYAKSPGAVAAPTAGLHFSKDLFTQLDNRGVIRTAITLHVGIGTFRPVSVDHVEDHKMEEERYTISPEAAQKIRDARAQQHRVIAVGTTTVRTLETAAAEHGTVEACNGRSDLFIYPPYQFHVVDGLLTNFHLPKSTLLMMICALAEREFVLEAYQEAVREKYRFYSYGDCMLIL